MRILLSKVRYMHQKFFAVPKTQRGREDMKYKTFYDSNSLLEGDVHALNLFLWLWASTLWTLIDKLTRFRCI